MRVPKAVEGIFLKAQGQVSRYFKRRRESVETGTLSISEERYILVRGGSMSVEFFDLVTSLYPDSPKEEAARVARNLLFDVAHSIGKADAKSFQRRMGLSDPIEKLSAGPVHFAMTGWAFVDIGEDSRPTPDENYFLIYEHPHSFEAEEWLKRGRRSPTPVCIMNAGYSSGWCDESFGLSLVAVEVECVAAGGKRCQFVMAPPSRIEEHVARHPGRAHLGSRPAAEIPEFFQRKRLEEQLRRSYETLERRVVERTAELLERNEQLQREVVERKKAEEARDEFLSVAAHELKTPITSLRGFSQLLLRQAARGGTDPARLSQALEAIDQQSLKLTRLIGRLLDVSRIRAGRLEVEPRITEITALVRESAEGALSLDRRHNLVFTAPEPVSAEVDPERLEQVVANLVGNAVKFSPPGVPVEVEVRREGADAVIVVSDRGVGIPPSDRERIFERFYQADPDQPLGGMGLGLYISRQIVELHGGRIDAEPRGGGGTQMVVRLPVGRGRA